MIDREIIRAAIIARWEPAAEMSPGRLERACDAMDARIGAWDDALILGAVLGAMAALAAAVVEAWL